MAFIADLHIHSRFSRATSRSLTLPSLAGWAACKGIGVLGSGDFTHPVWREEMRAALLLDEESGLYRLKIAPHAPPEVENAPGKAPLFCLQTEISSIYKRGGKTRKVHNLVFMPTLEAAEKFCRRLALVGNLNSDGRPILGLDSRDLLEMVLECDENAHLAPAHIWTPWFSLFGSKSGFDSLEECFGDLSPHIFALETGLSSDPAMNRLVSALDGYALISNSDAHSGANLGREANLFSGAPAYKAMFDALRAQARRRIPPGGACRFLGTLEFYPEEGKYHLDGHRACNVSLEPAQSAALGDVCPVCGKPLTIGVLHRVLELADRQAPPPLEAEPDAGMLIPLPEILAEILQCGASSRRVRALYVKLLHELGPELEILRETPLARLYAAFEPLGEAIARMRKGEVRKIAGFDGQFGKIRVFDDGDLRQFKSRALLPGLLREKSAPARPVFSPLPKKAAPAQDAACAWSQAQLAAMEAVGAPVFVAAGPGAGKTRVLTGRIERLLKAGTDPEKILALTFTRRAASEMRERLAASGCVPPHCGTLHAFALSMREKAPDEPRFMLLPDETAREIFRKANSGLTRERVDELWREISVCIECLQKPSSAAQAALDQYAAAKRISRDFICLDYNDLLLWLLARADLLKGRFSHLLVDEIQDFSRLQLETARKLLPDDGEGFFGIGDPDQSIYGFRGAAGQDEASLREIWPSLRVFHLGVSYRAGQGVLDLARRALGGDGKCGELAAASEKPTHLHFFHAADARQEADWIARKISSLIGSSSHTLLDDSPALLTPGDIAILVRLRAQMPLIVQSLERAGLPVRAPAMDAFWEDGQARAFLAFVANALADENFTALLKSRRLRKPSLKISPEIFLREFGGGLEAGEADVFAAGPSFTAISRLWKKCGDWKNFFEEAAWLGEAERIASRAATLRLLTLHASKGLEFEAVFLPGLEDGVLPLAPRPATGENHENPGAPAADAAEERRLLYVGITRAARYVFASCAAERQLYGRIAHLPPSPFLLSMRDLMQESVMKRHTREMRRQASLFGARDVKLK